MSVRDWLDALIGSKSARGSPDFAIHTSVPDSTINARLAAASWGSVNDRREEMARRNGDSTRALERPPGAIRAAIPLHSSRAGGESRSERSARHDLPKRVERGAAFGTAHEVRIDGGALQRRELAVEVFRKTIGEGIGGHDCSDS